MTAWTFPAGYETALWAAAAARLPAGALEHRALAAAIAARTVRYTSERGRLHAPMAAADRVRDLAARALFFTVADAAKVAVPLAELAGRGLLPAGEPLRVLDVGAGCGAMMLGARASLDVLAPERRLDVLAIDSDADALALAADAAARAAPPPALAVRTQRVDLATAPAPLPAGPFELILAGTVVNELPVAVRVPLVRTLLARLAPDGALVIVEPALRETSRALHELRDALLAAGDAHVFAPCTRTTAPCPALADPRDWCHEDRAFSPPPRLAQLVRATGLRERGLKFAYLTLRRAAAPLVEVAPGRRALRVVSDPLDGKGTVERIVCDDAGRAPLRRLRREKSEALRALAHARRGDVLVATDDPASADDLEVVRPAGD